MTIEEYKEQYKEMSAAEVRSLISSSKAFRDETERIYTGMYHKRLNKHCGDCWMDAYILIMKGDPEKIKAMMNKRYDLRAGAILIDPMGDRSKNVTTHNITDELAIYHLRVHPTCVRLFSKLPEDWQKDVAGSDRKAQEETKTGEQAEVKAEVKKAPQAKKTSKKTTKK